MVTLWWKLVPDPFPSITIDQISAAAADARCVYSLTLSNLLILRKCLQKKTLTHLACPNPLIFTTSLIKSRMFHSVWEKWKTNSMITLFGFEKHFVQIVLRISHPTRFLWTMCSSSRRLNPFAICCMYFSSGGLRWEPDNPFFFWSFFLKNVAKSPTIHWTYWNRNTL